MRVGPCTAARSIAPAGGSGLTPRTICNYNGATAVPPGGAAGTVEVFAKKPLEVSWEPILLEGRFEAREAVEDGVVYRLHDARMRPMPRGSGR